MFLSSIQHLDEDIRLALLRQLRDLWTHTSTSMEGNTLSLGETRFVLEEGLTISGKPLKDHQEVVGHARAIELMYSWLQQCDIRLQDLLHLHTAVQVVQVLDIYKPTGAWKREPNGTDAVTAEGEQVFIEYARVADVPFLMTEWLERLNQFRQTTLSLGSAIDAYATLHLGFVHIHPFWDANGRMARLLSNLPLLWSGHLPVIIARSSRKEYIDLLTEHHLAAGQLSRHSGVWPDAILDRPFADFCQQAYQSTQTLLDRANQHQEKRHQPMA